MTFSTEPFDVALWPAGPPGSQDWQQQEQETTAHPPFDITVVRNVTRPRITAYLPDPAIANGTAVVVCPGGAFHFLAIDHEGVEVAAWLNARGIAAFVLRYRLIETAADDDAFRRQVAENMADRARMRELMAHVRQLSIADGQQALRIVRQRAQEWRLATERIGIMGFSAGAVVTTGAAVWYDAESRPSFAAPVYTAPLEIESVPDDAPPLFLALASDDAMAVGASLPLYSAWRAAGRAAELHVYASGGHGFGMRRQGIPSDHWIERFGEWLAAQGLSHE